MRVRKRVRRRNIDLLLPKPRKRPMGQRRESRQLHRNDPERTRLPMAMKQHQNRIVMLSRRILHSSVSFRFLSIRTEARADGQMLCYLLILHLLRLSKTGWRRISKLRMTTCRRELLFRNWCSLLSVLVDWRRMSMRMKLWMLMVYLTLSRGSRMKVSGYVFFSLVRRSKF